MFLRKSWYVAAWAHDIANKPLARRILSKPVVLFRGADGAVRALEDHCPHRHVPLSIGRVEGDTIRCGYHGMVFDGSGNCVQVPTQSGIPPRAKVQSYPIAERHGWIWIWMGEAEDADPALIPDFSKLTDPAYRAVGKTNHVNAGYKLVNDNLMDLSHVGYVHQSTIGNPAMAQKATLTSKRTESGVQVKRTVANIPPPPTYVKTGVLAEGELIDRWQIIDFFAPSFIQIHVGGAKAGTGALEGRYEQGLNLWVLNAITPETETSSHYFWASVRAHALSDPEADKLMFSEVSTAFEEDMAVLEAQQRVLLEQDDSWDLALKSDMGVIEARRALDAMLAKEKLVLAAAA